MDPSVNPFRILEENPHLAEKFAGSYQFVDLEILPDAEFLPGELDEYKKCENYYQIVVNGNEISFSDLGGLFDYKGTLLVNEPHITESYLTNITYPCVKKVKTDVKLWNDDTLVVEETHTHDATVHYNIFRRHQLVAAGDKVHLKISDSALRRQPDHRLKAEEPRFLKTYVRVPDWRIP